MGDKSQTGVMEGLELYLDDLDQIARLGFAKYREIPIEFRLEHCARSRANCTYDHMMAEADRRFEDVAKLRRIETNGLKVWAVDDHTVIRFKKMNHEGQSRNYQTRQAKAFDRGDDIPELPAPATRVTVGYVPDPTDTSIQRVQVALVAGKRVAWCAAIIPSADREAGMAMWEDVTIQRPMTGFPG